MLENEASLRSCDLKNNPYNPQMCDHVTAFSCAAGEGAPRDVRGCSRQNLLPKGVPDPAYEDQKVATWTVAEMNSASPFGQLDEPPRISGQHTGTFTWLPSKGDNLHLRFLLGPPERKGAEDSRVRWTSVVERSAFTFI